MAQLCRAAKRKIERENGAPGRIGRGVDLVLMRLDDRFDETQAEADAPPRAASYRRGPSGSGKSSVLRCLNSLVEPSSGMVLFDGAIPDR